MTRYTRPMFKGPPYILPEFSGFGLRLGGRRADSIASYVLPDGTSLSPKSYVSDNHWADINHFGENGHSGPFHDYNDSPIEKKVEGNEVDSSDYYSYDGQDRVSNSYDYSEHNYDNHIDMVDARNDTEIKDICLYSCGFVVVIVLRILQYVALFQHLRMGTQS